MINDVYQVTLTLLNKERQGNVKPERFNQIAKLVQESIFSEYFEIINRAQNRDNRGLTNEGYGNLVDNEEFKISQFRQFENINRDGTSGLYELPLDLYFMEDNGLTTTDGYTIPRVKAHEISYLNNSLAKPSTMFPVFTYREDNIQVFPSTFTANVNLTYLRRPRDPRWTYTSVGGIELFNMANPSFQDFELHVSEFPNICVRVLSHFGITIREADVIQIAKQIEQEITIKDNS